MAKRVFLDTNIIIDILGMRSNYASAATVLQMGVRKQIELYITNITVANAMDINKNLLAKYIYGITVPSPERLSNLKSVIHALGKEMQLA